MNEETPGGQHLTGWVLELLARHSSQELAKGCWGDRRAHGGETALWELVGAPGVKLWGPIRGCIPDQLATVHLKRTESLHC